MNNSCSLPCYKEHQKEQCVPTQNTDDKFVEDEQNLEPTLHEPFSTEDTVPHNKLELLSKISKASSNDLLH